MRKRPTAIRRRARPEAAVRTPWWLGSDEEECPHCGQSYAYEAEVLCMDCDAPMCPLCAGRIAKRTVCPECAGEGGH